MTDYCTGLLDSHSWSAVKLDLYGRKFFYANVLHRPWVAIDLIKPSKVQRSPDTVTIDEANPLFEVPISSATVCIPSPGLNFVTVRT